VISLLKQRGESSTGDAAGIWSARTMFDVALIVSDAVRDVERRDAASMADSPNPFNASFIIGGQIAGEPPRLFRTFAEGNFIEAGADTPFFQTGETKYGKPIIDPVITSSTSLGDAMKCILVSFDSTMRSNLSVGMPIDLACLERDSLSLSIRHRFEREDAYFRALGKEWRDGVREVFRRLPAVPSGGLV
jgi:putative proteasome-type protease